jgi:hypothetical protein
MLVMRTIPDDDDEHKRPADFGCATCFGADAGALWSSRPWTTLTRLIEDSHFGVTISGCPRCAQRFVRIFTEFVDWSGGDDAQHWDVLPVSEEEARELAAQGEDVSLTQIEALSDGRRHLQVDYPTSGTLGARFSSTRLMIMPGR